MNSITQVGRLAGDAETVNYTKADGTQGQFVKVLLIENVVRRNPNEPQQDNDTLSMHCNLIYNTGSANLKKGQKIAVVGQLKPNNYTKDGVKVYSTVIQVSNWEYASDSKPATQAAPGVAAPQMAPQMAAPQMATPQMPVMPQAQATQPVMPNGQMAQPPVQPYVPDFAQAGMTYAVPGTQPTLPFN